MQHSMSALPVVDEVYVDGRRIPIFCRRDYRTAKAEYWAALQKPLPVLSLPLNVVTKQVRSIANEAAYGD